MSPPEKHHPPVTFFIPIIRRARGVSGAGPAKIGLTSRYGWRRRTPDFTFRRVASRTVFPVTNRRWNGLLVVWRLALRLPVGCGGRFRGLLARIAPFSRALRRRSAGKWFIVLLLVHSCMTRRPRLHWSRRCYLFIVPYLWSNSRFRFRARTSRTIPPTAFRRCQGKRRAAFFPPGRGTLCYGDLHPLVPLHNLADILRSHLLQETAEEEGAFWETHSVVPYLDQMETMELEVACPRKKAGKYNFKRRSPG